MTDDDDTDTDVELGYATVVYSCEDCDVTIEGRSGDPQEAPWLFCPDCDEEMEFDAEWD